MTAEEANQILGWIELDELEDRAFEYLYQAALKLERLEKYLRERLIPELECVDAFSAEEHDPEEHNPIVPRLLEVLR